MNASFASLAKPTRSGGFRSGRRRRRSGPCALGVRRGEVLRGLVSPLALMSLDVRRKGEREYKEADIIHRGESEVIHDAHLTDKSAGQWHRDCGELKG